MRVFVAVVSFVWALALAAPAFAQAHAKFVIDGLVNCRQPAVSNYPLHLEGTGQLSTDRTATLAVSGNVENTTYHAVLGGKPTEVENGSASLRVTGRRSLRAIRDYPNNLLVVDLTVTGGKCAIRVSNRLKPGKREYTFNTAIGLAVCDKPKVTSATCSPQ
jgi:hypothetical protein